MNNRFQFNEKFKKKVVDDNIYLCNDNICFRINETSNYILELMEKELTYNEILEILLSQFHEGADKIHDDLFDFVDFMVTNDVVKEKNAIIS